MFLAASKMCSSVPMMSGGIAQSPAIPDRLDEARLAYRPHHYEIHRVIQHLSQLFTQVEVAAKPQAEVVVRRVFNQ